MFLEVGKRQLKAREATNRSNADITTSARAQHGAHGAETADREGEVENGGKPRTKRGQREARLTARRGFSSVDEAPGVASIRTGLAIECLSRALFHTTQAKTPDR